MIKTHWFKVYRPEELPNEFELVFQSWDTANKCSELSDYTVCTTWGLVKKHVFLLHVLRKRLDYPDLRRAVRQAAQEYEPKNILIEDKASGTQLIQDLKADGMYSVTCYAPKMDKVMRMHSVISPIENGLVHIPAHAEWLAPYLHEMAVFPNGKYDDQVDSTSQALDWVKDGVLVLGVVEYIRSEEAKLGLRSQSHAAGTAQAKSCPQCQSIAVVRIGSQQRCSQCGLQWGKVPQFTTPSRADLFRI
jgi:predicted phage terminase large subunit-like protein